MKAFYKSLFHFYQDAIAMRRCGTELLVTRQYVVAVDGRVISTIHPF